MKTPYHIVIVDDDADDREIVRDAFASTSGNFEYSFLENGDRLIEFLEKSEGATFPSLILLDLNMPGKDGRETLHDLKKSERFHHIPVIIFTTSSSHRDKNMAYDLGANCFVTKPDTFNKLIELAQSITRLWLQ